MSNKSRLAAIALLFGCLGFVPLVLTMNRSPLPWNDEILWASTSYSVFRHGESAPSVLAEFPQAGRFDLFYGPVGFKLGVLAFKLFGISPISFRLLSLLGALIVTVASGLLVRVLGGSWLAAAVYRFLGDAVRRSTIRARRLACRSLDGSPYRRARHGSRRACMSVPDRGPAVPARSRRGTSGAHRTADPIYNESGARATDDAGVGPRQPSRSGCACPRRVALGLGHGQGR